MTIARQADCRKIGTVCAGAWQAAYFIFPAVSAFFDKKK